MNFSGDALPDSTVFTEPGNPANNNTVFTTVEFENTAWVAEDGFLKISTSNSRGIYFGGWNMVDPASVRPSAPTVGNKLTVTSLLTPGSQYWAMQLGDTVGNAGYMTFDAIGNGDNFPGVWVSINDSFVQVRDETFDLSALHTYAIHIFDDQVAYYIDGAEVIRGNAVSLTSSFYGVGDFSGSTPTGSGTMWVDSLAFDNAAGMIPEPSASFLLTLSSLSLLLRRRR